MATNRTPEQIQKDNEGCLFGALVVLALVIAIVAVPAMILGLVLWGLALRTWDSKERLMGIAFVAVLSIGYFYLMRLQIAQVATQLYAVFQKITTKGVIETAPPMLMRAWLLTVLAAPTVALIAAIVRPRGVVERHEQQQREESAKDERQSTQAAKKAATAPDLIRGAIVLGRPIGSGGDLRSFTADGWAIYPEAVLRRGLNVIGLPGSGKTETLLRLAYGAATAGWQVIFLDCKGDKATAIKFAALMKDAGKNTLFHPNISYDLWRGDANALKDRFLLGLNPQHDYYKAVTDLVLDLAINAPGGIPRSSKEFLNRLRLKTLRELYKDDPYTFDIVAGIKRDDAESIFSLYNGLFRKVGDQFDGEWAFEDCEAAYFLIDGVSLQDQAGLVGRCLLQDFNHYAARRKPEQQNVLFIVDEYSAIEKGTEIHPLFERLRGYGAAIVVGSQSYGGLGEQADRILGATSTKIVHQCDDPERLTERAGERVKLNFTIHDQTRDDKTKNKGGTQQGAQRSMSYREEREATVDPSIVRQLKTGEAFIISSGQALKVRIAQAIPSDFAQVEAAYLFEHAVDPARQAREQPRQVAPQAQPEQPIHDDDQADQADMIRI
jgi:hypothetical protein